MRMRRRERYIPVTMLLILIILSGCSTAPAAGARPPDPGLEFPRFPDPFGADGEAIPVLEGEEVTLPLWYWKKITEYVVDVEKVREQYKAWREVYGGGNNDVPGMR
jgi:hypothetical protein